MKKYILIIIMFLMSKNIFAREQINNFEQISNLVTPVSYFINHVSQLTKLKDNLLKYKKSSIVGISGMGKTQLARMYAYENEENYDIIWFIDCNLDIDPQLLKLAKDINAQLKAPVISDNVSLVRKDLMTYLASKNRWLLVFDNLKVKENKKVEDFIGWEHNGNVIFCSQDGELLPNIIKVNAFTKPETEQLAQDILENKRLELIEFLVNEFEGYPILIVQGAQVLNQVQGLDLAEYKKKIRASDDKIELNIKLAINELKPSTRRILNEIALVNNQNFSKELLSSITSDKDSLDDDIYNLSKFALISNVDPNENNPLFEMHDVIVEKILPINGAKNNKEHIDQVATNLLNSIPKSVMKANLFRGAKTISGNLEIITKNAEKYNISIYKILELKLNLITQYINSSDLYNAGKLVNWFNEYKQKSPFKLWLMNNEEKFIYASYLGRIGGYYRRCAKYQQAIKYYIEAKKIFDEVKGYESLKCNLFFTLALSYIELGELQEAERNIQIMEDMFNQNLVDKADIATLYYARTKLFIVQGKYDKALEQINNTINTCIEIGSNSQELFFSPYYIAKSEILNSLGKYQEAYSQAEQVYDMNEPNKKDDDQIFGRIFTQMSRAELGLGKAKEALEYAEKAKNILINDPARPNNNLNTTTDTDLARAFVAEGDALFALNKNEEAVEDYNTAENIYWNNYRGNMKNIEEISIMYLAASKASCHVPFKSRYINFLNHHVKNFGKEHPRSIEILELNCHNLNNSK